MEMKFFYFQQVDVLMQGGSSVNNSTERYRFPYVLNRDDTIRDELDWWFHENVNKYFYYSLISTLKNAKLT